MFLIPIKLYGKVYEYVFDKNAILETATWYYSDFSLQIIGEWHDKGILEILEFIDYSKVALSMEEINKHRHENKNSPRLERCSCLS